MRKDFASPLLIAVDAGHGGNDIGAQSEMKKYKEKNLALTAAMMLRRHLKDLGYHVVLTRKKDVFVPLRQRTTTANKENANLFISIHFNSAPNKKAEGVEIFYYEPQNKNEERSVKSKILSQHVLSHIVKYTKAQSRGVKTASFHVVKYTKMPAILVEGGFLSNEKETHKLKNPKYLNRIAYGTAQGLHRYFKDASNH